MKENNNNFPKPTLLMILDGFGKNENLRGNAIAAANTPFLDDIFKKYPSTTLQTSGHYVGLPDGQMGNSEVGHMNIGAGRVVFQELSRISNEIETKTFFENPMFLNVISKVKSKNGALHLIGLLSDGGVHSHISHLFALIKLAKINKVEKVYIHALLDGRDVPPKCAQKYIDELEKYIKEIGLGEIATIGGRYYGMDRDKRWDRVKLHYDAINSGHGNTAASATEALLSAYERNETDEFVLPTVIGEYSKNPLSKNDAIIMFNFRPDRARQLTTAFTEIEFDGFLRSNFIEHIPYVCMTSYDESFKNVFVAYPPQVLKNTLGEYLSSLGIKQLRIAETEKYAHVTFFFNGGVEIPNPFEERVLIPSPNVATYDLQPEMSAFDVTGRLLKELDTKKYDFIVLNFANADMVGHTGIFEAAVTAVEVLDKCISAIVPKVLELGGQILLTADHGNADEMLDENGKIVTSHSLNPVPLIHIAAEAKELKDGGALCDIAPTLLRLMGFSIPPEMTGHSLISN